MNLTYTIANNKILETKYDFLADNFDCNLLLSEKKVYKSTYYKKQNQPENNIEDILDNNIDNCDFID